MTENALQHQKDLDWQRHRVENAEQMLQDALQTLYAVESIPPDEYTRRAAWETRERIPSPPTYTKLRDRLRSLEMEIEMEINR